MEVGQSHAIVGKPVQVRRTNLATEGTDIGEAHIVNDDQQNIGGGWLAGSGG